VGGVAARRAVATADVAAGKTEPQMNPGRPYFEALFAPERSWRDRINFEQMGTRHFRPPGEE
jgi:hypothetical protein